MESQIEQLIRIVANLNERILRLEYEESKKVFYMKSLPKSKNIEKRTQEFL